jgi:hypothetical protein
MVKIFKIDVIFARLDSARQAQAGIKKYEK